jgi:modulator of FtsH protease
MRDVETVIRRSADSILETNQVLRRTYLLLGLTLLFSGVTAGFAMISNAPYPGMLLTIVGIYGLMFLTQALRNSVWGIAAVFAFTGFMGYTLGPLLNAIIGSASNGSQIVMTSLGATGIIFFALSAYVLTTRKDFSYLGGFLFVAVMVAFLTSIAGLFLQIPLLSLVVSAAFALISSGLILFQTSAIIHGGERNFIMATISLYVSIYNLFVSLLQIFSALSNRDSFG